MMRLLRSLGEENRKPQKSGIEELIYGHDSCSSIFSRSFSNNRPTEAGG